MFCPCGFYSSVENLASLNAVHDNLPAGLEPGLAGWASRPLQGGRLPPPNVPNLFVQMNSGPMDRLCYGPLDHRSFGTI